MHDRVVGVTPEGVPYDATDPHLLRWVHLAEMDSFLAAHQRYGTPRLDAEQRDGYVADMARVGAAVGVIDPPRTEAEMRTALAAYRPELRGTKNARDAARFLMRPSQLPVVAYGPYAVLAAAAVSSLPWWARLPLRLPLLPVTETVMVRPASKALMEVIRWSLAPTGPRFDVSEAMPEPVDTRWRAPARSPFAHRSRARGPAMVARSRSSAASSAATSSSGTPGSRHAAGTSNADAFRSDLRSTRATRSVPSRKGST